MNVYEYKIYDMYQIEYLDYMKRVNVCVLERIIKIRNIVEILKHIVTYEYYSICD